MSIHNLHLMTRELSEMVRLDWIQRESVRACLSQLAKYGYLPDLSEDATPLVLKQAELATEYGTG